MAGLKPGDFQYTSSTKEHRKKKQIARLNTFIEMYKSRTPFEMVSGPPVTFAYEASVANQMMQQRFTGLKFKNANDPTKTYGLGSIKKSDKFGGRDAPAGNEAEGRAWNAIVGNMRSIMQETGDNFVFVVIPGINDANPYEITHAVWTDPYLKSNPGESGRTLPKADLELWSGNRPVVFLSYKDNVGRRKNKNGTISTGRADPKGFQQFGGMSASASPEINAFPEVQNFMEYFRIKAEEHEKSGKKGPWLSRACICEIQSTKLKKMAMYGLGWQDGTGFSRNNCQMVLQGRIELSEISDDVYEIVASHTQVNYRGSNDGINDSYRPVLLVRPNESRATKGFGGVRFMLYPHGGTGPVDTITPRVIETTIANYKKQKAAEERAAKQNALLEKKMKSQLQQMNRKMGKK